MKKEEVYVSVESKEQAEQYRKVLEAIGENVEGYEIEYFEHFNARQLGPRGSGGWWLSLDYEKPCKINQTVYKEISFGHLVDLLTENPKIAVKVENELEFRALMEFYQAKGWLTQREEKPEVLQYQHKWGINSVITFHDRFFAMPKEDEGYKEISFPDFAKEHGLKMPLLISEDGVLLYDDDCWSASYLYRNTWILGCINARLYKGSSVFTDPLKTKAFSTREAAEKWIEAQKPKEKEISITQSINAVCTKSGVIFSNDGNFLVQVSRDQLSYIAAAIVELSND